MRKDDGGRSVKVIGGYTATESLSSLKWRSTLKKKLPKKIPKKWRKKKMFYLREMVVARQSS